MSNEEIMEKYLDCHKDLKRLSLSDEQKKILSTTIDYAKFALEIRMCEFGNALKSAFLKN